MTNESQQADETAALLVHPRRTGAAYREATGIYVRARLGDRWVNADIAQLDEPSLTRWLRSRGGDNGSTPARTPRLGAAVSSAGEFAGLREAAEGATPGPWVAAIDDHGRKGCEVGIWSEPAGYYPVENMTDGNDNAEADARFIATANPAVVLALLDRLEAAEGAVERMRDLRGEFIWAATSKVDCRCAADLIRKALDGPQGDAGIGVALGSTGEPQGPQNEPEALRKARLDYEHLLYYVANLPTGTAVTTDALGCAGDGSGT